MPEADNWDQKVIGITNVTDTIAVDRISVHFQILQTLMTCFFFFFVVRTKYAGDQQGRNAAREDEATESKSSVRSPHQDERKFAHRRVSPERTGCRGQLQRRLGVSRCGCRRQLVRQQAAEEYDGTHPRVHWKCTYWKV